MRLVPLRCCTNCYRVWLPTAVFCDWQTCLAKYIGCEVQKKNVDMALALNAKPQDEESVSAFAKSEVSDSASLVCKITKKGEFIEASSVKALCHGCTVKQLRLEAPVELPVPGDDKPLKGYFLKSNDDAPPTLEVEIGVQYSIDLKKVTTPLAPQLVEGMSQVALDHIFNDKSRGELPNAVVNLFKGKAISLQNLQERGERASNLKSKRRSELDSKGTSANVASGEEDAKSGDEDDDDEEEDANSSDDDGGPEGCATDCASSCQGTREGGGRASSEPGSAPPGSRAAGQPKLASSVASEEVKVKVMNGAQLLFEIVVSEAKKSVTKPSPAKSIVASSDYLGEDDARTTRGGHGGSGKAKSQQYWIEKIKLVDAMSGRLDQRSVLQANACVKRELVPGGDGHSPGERLQKHLVRAAMLQVLSDDGMPTATWVRVYQALDELVLAQETCPLDVLLRILEKHAGELQSKALAADHIEDAQELFDSFHPFQDSDSEAQLVFDVKKPRLRGLVTCMPAQKIASLITKHVVTKYLAARIRKVKAILEYKPVGKILEAVQNSWELPDESEPPRIVLEMMDELYTGIRALQFLMAPRITLDMEFAVIGDVESLHRHAELATSSGVLAELGLAAKAARELDKSLASIVRKCTVVKQKGPEVQACMKQMSTPIDKHKLVEHLRVLVFAVKKYESVIEIMPANICDEFRTLISTNIHRHFNILMSPDDNKLESAAFTEFQAFLQTALGVFPADLKIDGMMDECASRLRKLCSENFTGFVRDCVSKLLVDGKVDGNSLTSIDEALSSKGGLLESEAASDFNFEKPVDDALAGFLQGCDRSPGLVEMKQQVGQLANVVKACRKVCGERGAALQAKVRVVQDAVASAEALLTLDNKEKVVQMPAKDLEDNLIKVSRMCKALHTSAEALQLMGEDAGDAPTLVEVMQSLVADMGPARIIAHRSEHESLQKQVCMLAACVPEGDDDDARWHERITGEEEFPDFVEKCKDTLLKIDGEILAQKVSEAEKAFSHYKDLVGQIGDDSSEAWEEMGASLRAARISRSAQKLMTALTDPKNSKPALRAMVREEVAKHQAHNIANADFPGPLVARMKTAIKML